MFSRALKRNCFAVRSQDEWYDFIKLLSGKFSTYFSRSDYVNCVYKGIFVVFDDV